VEIRTRQCAVLSAALIPDRDMRRDARANQPAEELAGTVGRIGGKTFGLEPQALGSPLDHGLGCGNFVIVNVIVTMGSAVQAVKQATSSIPIVFAIAVDPLGSGLVTSLAHPGGNVTGLSLQETDTASKRFELLHEVIPAMRRLAIIGDAGYPDSVTEMREVEALARRLGIEPVSLEIRRADDIGPAFATLKPPADALYVAVDAFVAANHQRIVTLALGARLPTIFNQRAYVQAGALLSYGPNFADQFRGAADYVDKILRGAKPGDLPVEQPTKFELVVNTTTAQAIGLTIPESFLALADKVIE
jgi:putative tryptophan/tyrosine transport system substrate-binding protein